MAINDELGKRMKENYENISKTKLVRRMPVIIRIDGKAFHSFTRGFLKPFDYVLIDSMQKTMKYLCENIQGCVLGYTQSDEISLLLIDYQKLNSSAWFDNEVQKICSISASMATMIFNRLFEEAVLNISPTIQFLDECYKDDEVNYNDAWNTVEGYGFERYNLANLQKQVDIYRKALDKGALFDSRCFNIPKEEVANYFYWRQLDATRNSIQMIGQANFSHRELQGKSCNRIQDMLHEQRGINWNDFSIPEKRGTCYRKETYIVDEDGNEYTEEEGKVVLDILQSNLSIRTKWIMDENIPIFKGVDRNYIEKLI